MEFRCCGCGKVWTSGDARHCFCPTDVLYVRGQKGLSKLKSEWLRSGGDNHVNKAPSFRGKIANALRAIAAKIEG